MDSDSRIPAAVASVSHFQDSEQPSFCVESSDGARHELLDPWEQFPLIAAVATPSAVLIRMSELRRIGSWPVAFPGVGDMHTWQRLSEIHPLARCAAVTAGYRVHSDSLSLQLRKNAAEHHENFACAAESACEHRVRALASEELQQMTQRRCRLIRHCQALAAAQREGDRESFGAAARALEHDTKVETRDYCQLPFQHLLWFMNTGGGSEARERRRRQIYQALLTAWPSEAGRTRGVLRLMMARAAFPATTYLGVWLDKPWSLMRLRLVFEAVVFRGSRWGARLARALRPGRLR